MNTNGNGHRHGTPLWAKVVTPIFVAALIVIIWLALALARDDRADSERQCQANVQEQNNRRAMWEWLGDQLSASDNPETRQFQIDLAAELDQLHPVLICDEDNHAVPIGRGRTGDTSDE